MTHLFDRPRPFLEQDVPVFTKDVTDLVTAHVRAKAEIIAALEAMDALPECIAREGYYGAGNPDIIYRGPDRKPWVVQVFNDAGDWDYIDNVTAPDGRHWEWKADRAADREAGVLALPDEVANWHPKHPWKWGLTHG